MRKSALCICKNKGQICSDQHLCSRFSLLPSSVVAQPTCLVILKTGFLMTGLNMTRLDSLTGGMTSIMRSLISDQKKLSQKLI